jgi:hypothetical protein
MTFQVTPQPSMNLGSSCRIHGAIPTVTGTANGQMDGIGPERFIAVRYVPH